MFSVAIAGATGYTGVELARLLHQHPRCQVTVGTTTQYVGKHLAEVFPHLGVAGDLRLCELSPAALETCDIAFLALPHGVAIRVVAELPTRVKVVDLGADFRLRDPQDYRRWYGLEPAPQSLLDSAVYGLPELFRADIPPARLIANPGCYVTGATLAIAPLLARGLVTHDDIIIDGKSGVSGAGRGLSLGVHFSEVNENLKAYNIGGAHRHTPEIEQNLTRVAGRPVTVTFTPHLVPMTRGLLTTAYLRPAQSTTTGQVLEVLRSFYADEPFVRVLEAGALPQTKQVTGSNRCDLGAVVDSRTGRVIVISAIDNLIKGAAGQAIQNMNLMLDLPETLGLGAFPSFP